MAEEQEQKPLEEMTGDELFEEYMAIKDNAFQIKRIKQIKNLGKRKFGRNFELWWNFRPSSISANPRQSFTFRVGGIEEFA